jgi:hypothetical protein
MTASQSADSSEVPEIPACDVERGPDGLLRITHKGTGETETADTEERAVIAGVMLRFSAVQRREQGEIPFRTGEPLS